MSQAAPNSITPYGGDALRRARPHVINSDGMAPTLRPRRDVAMILPTTSYFGEGIYAVVSPVGGIELYRVASTVGKLRLSRDNKAYPPHECTVAEFEEVVIGKMAGRLEFYDRAAYRSFIDAFTNSS